MLTKDKYSIVIKRLLLIAVLGFCLQVSAQIPSPSSVFGFKPGTDYKAAGYGEVMNYYQQLAKSSPRVKLTEIGKSVDDRSQIILFISGEKNLKALNKWKVISQKLAKAEISEKEAQNLARTGKTVVWIDAGMHANEMASAQMAPELAYRVATEETPEMQKIRENVVFILMPVMNPDGLDLVTSWYKKQLGTPYETTSPPWLYQRYVGHDNNRDWYMGNMPETQNVMKVLYQEWFPQIVYNQHQDGSTWKRMFVPPFRGPVNPNIHPAVTATVNEIGAAMAKRFALEGKPGIIAHVNYTMWWNGGGRTVPYYHNQIGILTEMSHNSPTPYFFNPKKRPRTVSGILADSTSIFYPAPWLGGESHFSEPVEYMITSSIATLNYAADRRADLLYGIYKMGRDAIEKRNPQIPYAYVVSAEQHDPAESVNMINALIRGGLKVYQTNGDLTISGKEYPKGSFVLYTAQAFRPYLVDLMEKQHYPDRREYPGGPPEKPYDITGWTLPLQMGVDVERVFEKFGNQNLKQVPALLDFPANQINGKADSGFIIENNANNAFRAVNELLAKGAKVSVVTEKSSMAAPGDYWVEETSADVISNLGLKITLGSKDDLKVRELRKPKVGIYTSWTVNIDEGWTRWVLQQYKTDLDTLHNRAIQNKDLSQYTSIILPSQNAKQLLHGYDIQRMPKEYTDGLELEGAQALLKYVEDGGTLIAFDEASDFVIDQYGLPVRNVVAGKTSQQFYIPGSLIALNINDTSVFASGMPKTASAMFVKSRAFEVLGAGSGSRAIMAKEKEAPIPDVEIIASYAKKDALQSGWALGIGSIEGKPAVVRIPKGKGQIVLFAFRPQFRGQTRNTYKLIFNAIIEGAMQPE